MSHPFIFRYNEVNPTGIRKVCHQAVSVLTLHRGDVLFSDLETPTIPRMFFVTTGSLLYFQGFTSKAVNEYSWMSEGVLWTRWTHCGTARCNTESRILQVDAEGFQDIVSHFPSDHAGSYAAEFVTWANSCAQEHLSDLGATMEEAIGMVSAAFPEGDSDSDLLPRRALKTAQTKKKKLHTLGH
jgi:hypothetical protein